MKKILGVTVLLLIGAVVMFIGVAIKRGTSRSSQNDNWCGDYET